jgi:outer membrane protein assembly factor BamB
MRSLLRPLARALVCVCFCGTSVVAAPATRPQAPPPMFPLELRGVVSLNALPSGSPVADGLRVYVPIRPDGLVAVGLATGEVAWRAEVSVSRGPVHAGGRLFVTTADTLESLDPATGTSTWRAPLPAAAVASPLVSGNLVIVPLESGEVVALGSADGRVAWRLAVGGRPGGPVLALGEAFLAALDDGKLVSLTPSTGEKRWEQRVGGAITGLAGQGNLVYAGSLDNFFYCLDAETGRIRWRWRTGADVVGQASLDEKRVYFVSLDNVIRALDRTSGVQRWKRSLVARPVVGPLRIGDLLLLSSQSAELRAVSVEDGEAAGSYGLDGELGTAPVFAAGSWPVADLLLAVTVDGSLVMLGRKVTPGVVPLATLPGSSVDVTAPPPPQPAPPPG